MRLPYEVWRPASQLSHDAKIRVLQITGLTVIKEFVSTRREQSGAVVGTCACACLSGIIRHEAGEGVNGFHVRLPRTMVGNSVSSSQT